MIDSILQGPTWFHPDQQVHTGVFAGHLDPLTEVLSQRLDQCSTARCIAAAGAAQVALELTAP